MPIPEEYEGRPHGMRGTLRLIGFLAFWMFRKLWRNRHKRHWLTTSEEFLLDRLKAEYEEFLLSPTWDEAADLANLTAMCADYRAHNLPHNGPACDPYEGMTADETADYLRRLGESTSYGVR